jgi:hypothetical protein
VLLLVVLYLLLIILVYSLAVSALSSSSFNNNSGRIFVDHTGNSTQYRPAFLNPSSTTPADNGVTLSAEL